MIPPLDDETGHLPPGIHDATLSEVSERFADNFSRRRLFDDLERTVEELRERGVAEFWVGGSFTTAKHRPGDVDLVYDPRGLDMSDWGVLRFERRKELKRLRKIDLWPFPSPQPGRSNLSGTITILEFFQRTVDGAERGVVRLVDEQGDEGESQ